MLNTQWNTPQALCPIKGVAGAAAIFFFFLNAPPGHLCHGWSRAALNWLCDGRKRSCVCQLNRSSVLFNERRNCLADWVVSEHGALLVGSSQRVRVRALLSLFSRVQVGDQGIWHRMTGRVSGAALTFILVPRFHQKVCVCVCSFVHLVLP